MKWGLIYNYNIKKAYSLANDIFDFLKDKGELFIEKSFAKEKGVKGYSLDEINKEADIVITIGGDGTILRALEKIEKPIFAINSGGMGFLTEIESKYAMSGLEKLLDGKYNVEERAKLKVMVDDIRLSDAANEVTVQTPRIAKIIYLKIFVDNELIETFGADGVIVATPTGSTSYALSAGGPILDPIVEAMVIAPLAPFKLSARPWVVPLNKKIGIKLLAKSKESKIVIDGETSQSVTSESDIVITGSEKKARYVRFGESFYQMVRLKLVR
ncbi:sugar kinase [Thermoplasmatales archaeon SG8-52-1]|nr:MAG: sugar kinase [Thermoplasmatales archaeon SG8-52-1]